MLVAPLDWGLGHATRCVPIIKFLLNSDFKVIIGAEGDQKILLAGEFPGIEFVNLKGYRLKYGVTKRKTTWKIILQIPKILIAINREKRWLRNFLRCKHVDIVLADNRFGLYNSDATTIFITHQLQIKTSLGKLADAVVQRINYHFINCFNYCWVPDAEGKTNLAGELSHPALKPRTPIIYTGILSRIKKQQNATVTNKLLIIISGPEPQRTIFESILLAQLIHYTDSAILVRGLPAASDNIVAPNKVRVCNYLSATALEEAINQSEIIISRSGYSTIMDVLPLGKKCIFIPTPGQAEQEYLATYLSENKYACTAQQDDFLLPVMIAKAEVLQPPNLSFLARHELLEKTIRALIQILNNRIT